jgi:hypothetical protein
VSLVCGQVSGGLVVFDFDYAAVATLSGWLKGIGSALRPLFPISRSGKGYHVYLRVTGSQMATKKVAFNEEGELLIDVKQRVGTATRLHRYVEVAVANECAHLARAFKGMRNDALNKAAFRLGRFVGAGLLTPGQVYQALRQACEANHYLQDDGLDAFRRTCRSGLVNGTKCGQTFLEKVLAQIQSQ